MLKLRVHAEDERFDYPIGRYESGEPDVVLVGRYLSGGAKRAIAFRNTKRGITDNEAVYRETVEHCLVGWRGLLDASGVEVPFAKERALEVFDALPADLCERFLERTLRWEFEQKTAEGNLPGSSPAAPSATTPSPGSGTASST